MSTEEQFDPAAHRPSARGLVVGSVAAALALTAFAVIGVVPRLRNRTAIREDQARAEAEPAHVVVAHARPLAQSGGVPLPGSVQPVQETVVYARTSGYVRKYEVDLGDRVKTGQLLAELDTPEVDQELRQAQAAANQSRAGIEQARTQLELARAESNRYTSLRTTGVVSQQEQEEHLAQFDVQRANLQAAQAALANADANVRRLVDLKGFATVTAPFDGVITSRTTEAGQLVTAGTGAGLALFKVAKTDVMRLFVEVPQLYAPAVRVGQAAAVHIREFPGRSFSGTVTRSANELDTSTRTLLTEVRVPNTDGAIIAGMYAQVVLPLDRVDGALVVPSTAVMASARGTRAAVVEGGAVHWRTVQVDGDLGDLVALSSGLKEGDAVVVTPSDRLTEGLSVATTEAPQPKP